MPWATNIETITLIVEDLAASVDFYAAAFDAEPIDGDDVSSVFKLGALQINLLDRAASHELVEPAQVGEPWAGVRFVLTSPSETSTQSPRH